MTDEVLSRQPPCPGCAPHEHHLYLPCDAEGCACTAIDPFGVIDGQ